MPHRGIEPASAACRSDILPAELHPHTDVGTFTCTPDGDVFTVRAVVDAPRFEGAVEETGLAAPAPDVVQPDGTSPPTIVGVQHGTPVMR